MQECCDIFGKIEISAGMWNTYKTHILSYQPSLKPQNLHFKSQNKIFFGLKKQCRVGLCQYNIFFFGLS